MEPIDILLDVLKAHPFDTSLKLAFGRMLSPVLRVDDGKTFHTVTAYSRKILASDITAEFIHEIQQDLDIIAEQYKHVRHYNIYLHKLLPKEGIIRYGKLAV